MREEKANSKKVSKTSRSTAIGHLLYLTQHASSDGMDTIHKPFYWKDKVFLPTKKHVVVLNAADGKVEQILDIHMDDDDDDDDDSIKIECACVVVETAKDVLILASLSNATVVEWLVVELIKDEETSKKQLPPRRIFQLGPDFYQDKDQSNTLSNHHSRFIHFVSPPQNNNNNNSDTTFIKANTNHLIVYAVLQPFFSSTEHKKMKLVEIHIPTFRLETKKKRRAALNIPTFRIIMDSIPSCDDDVNFPQSLHCFDCTMMNNPNNNNNNNSSTRITRRMLAIVTKSTILLCYDNNDNNDKQQEMTSKKDYRFVSYTPVSNHYNTSSNSKEVHQPPITRNANNKNDIFISCVAFNTTTSAGDELRADLAIGYSNGKINVLYNFLDAIPQLFDTLSFSNTSDNNNKKKKQKHKKVKHLSKGTAMKVTTKDLLSLSSSSPVNIIIKTFHWHVHPVLTMIFFSPTLLMSAGEEAVVVTWSLFAQHSDATMNKPSHTLPRVTKGDILLLLAAKETTNNGILVVGRDNTLQWISIPDYRTKWQIQGIASVSGEHSSHTCTVQDDSTNCSNAVLMKLDPRMALPVCANLPGAPGFLQWYSNGTEEELLSRVQMQLQVAAFNRVSRTDRNGPATVVPSRVSHFAFSADGTTLLTVDSTVLQLTAIGRDVRLEDNQNTNSSTWNQVTTLKFWSSSAPNNSNKSNSPYHMNALIMHPHGRSASVAGLVLSNNGSVGVTASVQENCFRVWKRYDSSGRYAGSLNSILWRCVFQFQTPAGIYPPSGPMAFSPDDSLLAVANGNVVTIWDYEQSTLLRSIGSFFGNIVKDLYIDETGRIVVSGNAKLECHSIFPRKTISQSNSTKVWEWCDNNSSMIKARSSEEEQEEDKLSTSPTSTITSCYLAAFQEFAIAVSSQYLDREDNEVKNGSITYVYFIDAITGIQKSSDEYLYTITGAVHSICSCGGFVFLWMSTSELIKINSRGSPSLPSMLTPTISLQNEAPHDARSHAPALFDLLGDSKDVKPKRLHHVVVSSTIDDPKPKKRPTLVEGFGIGNVLNSELPLLSGSFIRDFVCQRLQVLED